MQSIAKLNTIEKFKNTLSELNISLPFVEHWQDDVSFFTEPIHLKSGKIIGNRFCIHPMEGWDGTADGKPSEFTIRRWQNFGKSGAKLIWGGEAVAVQHEGRANPNQLLLTTGNLPSIANLRQELVNTHERHHGSANGLFIGLQLTHSGRFSRPNDKVKLEPKILYHHPYLDKKFNVPADFPVMTDLEIEVLIEDYVRAAYWAYEVGFEFVDIKHCHGYLGHEFLTAYDRPGKYGGSFENRTRFLREIVQGIRTNVPDLEIGVRLSAFDLVAFEPDSNTKQGIPVSQDHYPQPFGASKDNYLEIDLAEPIKFLHLLQDLDIQLVNITAGSPYYNPHIQRPAMFPPSDGYLPPENPLCGVARHIQVVADLKKLFPELVLVGTGYTYLQEWLPNVAAAALHEKKVDSIGLGRMVLSYPELPADIMQCNEIDRRQLCRTFSDCTTAPRCGLISGCYPLDHFYKHLPEFEALQVKKKKPI